MAYGGYVTGCALFVTSQCDVRFTFQIQRFGEVFGHNAYHYTCTLLIHCCITSYVIILTLKYQRSNLKCRCKIHSTVRPSTDNCKKIRLNVKSKEQNTLSHTTTQITTAKTVCTNVFLNTSSRDQ